MSSHIDTYTVDYVCAYTDSRGYRHRILNVEVSLIDRTRISHFEVFTESSLGEWISSQGKYISNQDTSMWSSSIQTILDFIMEKVDLKENGVQDHFPLVIRRDLWNDNLYHEPLR